MEISTILSILVLLTNQHSNFCSVDGFYYSRFVSLRHQLIFKLGEQKEYANENKVNNELNEENQTIEERRREKREIALQTERKEKLFNIAIAVSSALVAILNYGYQFLHPVSSIELLFRMQSSSSPLAVIGKNEKPTVVDFWAPWCKNCKISAPSLYRIENDYKDKVNFILVNGDDRNNLDLIEKFGVDVIPHLALIDENGLVETALLGTVNEKVLSEDLNVLINNSKKNINEKRTELPYKMLGAFSSMPQDRKIQVIRISDFMI